MSDQEMSEQIDDRTLHAERVSSEILEKRLREMDQQLRGMTARAHGAEAACRLKDLFLARSEQKYWMEVFCHASARLAFYRDEIPRLEKENSGR